MQKRIPYTIGQTKRGNTSRINCGVGKTHKEESRKRIKGVRGERHRGIKLERGLFVEDP